MRPMASTSMSMTERSIATSSASARSSRRSIPNSRRSKRSMASVTDTANAETTAPPTQPPEPPTPRPAADGGRSSEGDARGAPRIDARPDAALIEQQIESLHSLGEIFAAALSEWAVLDSADEGEVLLPDLARQMIRRLVEPTRTRARLFDTAGKLIADSDLLRGPGDAVQVAVLPPAQRGGLLSRPADAIYEWIANVLPGRREHPACREGQTAQDYREARQALSGDSGSAVQSDDQTGCLVITVAVPLQRYKQVLGA